MSEQPYTCAHPVPRNSFSKTAASWPRLRGFQLQITSVISLHRHLLKKGGLPLNFQIGSRAGHDKRPAVWDALVSNSRHTEPYIHLHVAAPLLLGAWACPTWPTTAAGKSCALPGLPVEEHPTLESEPWLRQRRACYLSLDKIPEDKSEAFFKALLFLKPESRCLALFSKRNKLELFWKQSKSLPSQRT